MADLAKNKKAFYNYQVTETIEAGISLVGTEVKSCRAHNVSFVDTFVRIINGEALLHNFHISPYEQGNRNNHDPKRIRKLLLHKSQIRKLASTVQTKGLTLIPLSIYLKNGRVKMSLGLCRGKGKADKRESLKKRQAEKDMRSALSGRRK